ncbi:hypothetical protein KY363_08020 [Candidatus Woesearchaeota archaeon]|nr:hypothetical protein [Candidatus Woesearchaeota archaeon]
MDERIAERILEEIGETGSTLPDGDESLCFYENGYTPVRFSGKNFRSISLTREESDHSRDVIFIDGGNAEIFCSPSVCVHFVRVFHTVYRDNKRVSCGADEFYITAKAFREEEHGSLLYRAKLMKSRSSVLTDSFFSEDIILHSLDRGLMDGNARADLSKVPGMTRRMAELSVALLLTKDVNAGTILVIDGDLRAKVADEAKLINALGVVSRENQVMVCGISKTSRLLTSKGRSVIDLLNSSAPAAPWLYHPAAVSADADVKVSFVKFHRDSQYVFKFESFSTGSDPMPALTLLASNSTDPVFIGYPYGLVEADRFARVSNRDAEILRTTFMARAGKGWEQIEAAGRALDAHSVLDSI